jgi:hypothetical protein
VTAPEPSPASTDAGVCIPPSPREQMANGLQRGYQLTKARTLVDLLDTASVEAGTLGDGRHTHNGPTRTPGLHESDIPTCLQGRVVTTTAPCCGCVPWLSLLLGLGGRWWGGGGQLLPVVEVETASRVGEVVDYVVHEMKADLLPELTAMLGLPWMREFEHEPPRCCCGDGLAYI